MLKKLLVILALLWASVSAFAAADANKATAAELDAIKGIGPAKSKAILDERKKGDFKNWEDLITRVKGIGEGNAVKLSEAGLTVGGETYKKAAAKEAKAEEKKAAPKEAKKEDKKEETAAAKKEAKKEAKAEAKKEKEAKAEAKKEAKAEEKKAAASAAKPAASAKK